MQISNFIRQKGNYEDLLCYKKSMCVYDVTYYFAHKCLHKGKASSKANDFGIE